MKLLASLTTLAAIAAIVVAPTLAKTNQENRRPEHRYDYARKNEFEIQSDKHYLRLEQERLKRQRLEQQRKEKQRLNQQHRELQRETDPRRLNRQQPDQQRIRRQQLELQLKNQRIRNEMERERQQQMIRELYH